MSEAPIVETSAGPVRGIQRDEDAAFLGIPFAAPPTGARRFLPPQPVQPWTEVRDATAYGATPQRREEPNALIPEPSVPGSSTLNVNVFTPLGALRQAQGRPQGPSAGPLSPSKRPSSETAGPLSPSKRPSPEPAGSLSPSKRPSSETAGSLSPSERPRPLLPVLVWIHGGGYSAGSPASPWYDGRAFSRDGVVTVTVSYRLGFDGFGAIDGIPDNRGVRDWMAALEWVQQNIAAFGGDPGRVTIAGQSAGGGAVLTLLGMSSAQHLFHRAIAISGALGDLPRDLVERRSARLAEMVGVAATEEGFRSVSERQLTRRQYEASLLGKTGIAATTAVLTDGLPWGPMIDGDLIERPTVASLAAGVGADKPLLLGATDDEFTTALDQAPRWMRLIPASVALRTIAPDAATRRSWLAANHPQRRKGTPATLGRYVTDRVFRSLVVRVAESRPSTWVYRFAWASPVNGWSGHCLDVPFWWDCLGAERVAAMAGEAPPQRLADEMHAAMVAFIADGDPGWPAWRTEPGTTRVFGDVPPVSRSAYDDALPLA